MNKNVEKQAMVSKIVSLLQGWKLGFQNRTQSPRRDPCVYGTEVYTSLNYGTPFSSTTGSPSSPITGTSVTFVVL